MQTKIAKPDEKEVEELMQCLNRAYSGERNAYCSWWYLSKIVTGKGYEDLSYYIEKIAKDEEKHAGALAVRIFELGGVPPIVPLYADKTDEHFYLPKEQMVYNDLVRTIVTAEEISRDIYVELIEKTSGRDRDTWSLVNRLLEEETLHDKLFEDLPLFYWATFA